MARLTAGGAAAASLAAAGLAACGAPPTRPAGAVATTAPPAPGTPAGISAPAPAGAAAGVTTGTTTGTTVAPLGAGEAGTAAQVPWGQVGPGWLLAQWSPAPPSKGVGVTTTTLAGPGAGAGDRSGDVLYLLDPQGGRYRLPSGDLLGAGTGQAVLSDWSGDGSRAVLVPADTSGEVAVVDLRSGAVTRVRVPGGMGDVTFTRPAGKALLVSGQSARPPQAVTRFGLDGATQYTYPSAFPDGGEATGGYLETPDGTALVLDVQQGFEVVTNSGLPVRLIPRPGGDSSQSCSALHWWATGEFLASCTPVAGSQPDLWLVPLDGSAAAPLTGPEPAGSGDLGDLDAWAVPSGDFVQVAGGCGEVHLGKVDGAHRVQAVAVPGLVNDLSEHLVGSYGADLYIEGTTPCAPGSTLVRFDPARQATVPLLGGPVGGGSVVSAELFGEKPVGT